METHPKISIVVPTLNASEFIEKCLSSIYRQNYPKDRLEVVVVDNYSADDTLKIARQFPVKILMNKFVDAQASKMVALAKATGEYFIYLDADIELIGNNWFQKMLKPLKENQKIVGSFTGVKSFPSDAPICRYLSYDPFQRDPIFQFLSPSVTSTVIETKKGYQVCEYKLGKIPPTGLCLFRRKKILEVWNPEKDKKYMELDSLVRLVKAGYTRFAYVPLAQIHHPFLKGLGQLVQKRLKHIRKNYLNQDAPREYLWVDMRSLTGKVKIFLWVTYATLIFPATLYGFYKSLRYRDIVCMYEPVVAFVETWIIIFGFLRVY